MKSVSTSQSRGCRLHDLGCTEGIHGGDSSIPTKSISLGCVFMPGEVALRKIDQEIFQDLKMHPAIYSLIAGGKP